MDLEMVFNELSLRTPAPDIPTARQWMSDLISTMRTAQSYGLKGLRTQTDFHAIVLAEGYPLARWRNDNQVNRDEQTFLRTLATKAPFSVDIADSAIQKNIDNEYCEFSFQGCKTEGFKTAYWLETLALSLCSESLWDCSRLELEVIQIDDNGNLIEERQLVIHASRKNHVVENADNIKQRLQAGVINGIKLWERREKLFPNLQFCHVCYRQLRQLRSGDEKLQLILDLLSDLDHCVKNWESGFFSLENYPFEESGESEATLDKYWKERTFLCPDGEERLFARHVKLRSYNWRIHFFPEAKTKKVLIGYIGIHLPTVNYPT